VSGPTSYLTLPAGTPIRDRLGADVGTVERVLRHGDGCFDGIVADTPAGRRFVDAHEVRNVVGGVVELEITSAEVASGDPKPPRSRRIPRRGLRRLLGATELVPGTSWGRTRAADGDREAAVDALKRAFIADRLTLDDLAETVARAHEAETLGELDELVRRAGG
jgi:hypothetical protein